MSRAKIKLLFTETFNLLFCRHTTKWQIKSLFCYKLGRVQSWVKISLFFLESLSKESASQPGSIARTQPSERSEGRSLVLALRWGLRSEAHLRASLALLSSVSLRFQYVRNAKSSWHKTKKEESSDKSKGLQKIDAFKN